MKIKGNIMSNVSGEEDKKTYNFDKIRDLPYGENAHQKAALYNCDNVVDYKMLNDTELTFNNMLDATVGLNIVSEFYDVNCVSIIKHAKPCGVALGTSLYDAYKKAFDCDPISSFSGVAVFSKPLDKEIAKHLNSMPVEVVIAPEFDKNILKIFKDNSKIKLVKINTPLKKYRKLNYEEIIMTPFGVLIQDKNKSELNKDTFKVVTKEKPTPEQIEDAVFAWKISKYGKTNCAIIARDFQTSAISQGYTNINAAIEKALDYACDGSKDAILATDTVLTSEETLFSAIQGRINLIIQPGGSLNDEKIVEICDKYGISMITTGISNNKQ